MVEGVYTLNPPCKRLEEGTKKKIGPRTIVYVRHRHVVVVTRLQSNFQQAIHEQTHAEVEEQKKANNDTPLLWCVVHDFELILLRCYMFKVGV